MSTVVDRVSRVCKQARSQYNASRASGEESLFTEAGHERDLAALAAVNEVTCRLFLLPVFKVACRGVGHAVASSGARGYLELARVAPRRLLLDTAF